jgi:transcription antitermination factor NusG
MSVVSEPGRVEELKSWYALYTMPRTEKKADARLLLKGKKTFLPLIPSIRTWSDRKKKIFLPLIPGFVFVHCTHEEVFDCLAVQGVLGVIRYMGKPARVRDHEIQQIRILLKDPESIESVENFIMKEGEPVRVICGPFTGLIGKCIRVQGKSNVLIELHALQSIVKVNIPMAFLEPEALKVA